MNTTENNKLLELEQILTFLGINFIDYNGHRTSNGHKTAKTIAEIRLFFCKDVMTSGQYIKDIDWWDFRNDWNDLMFLVEKIESLGYTITIAGVMCKVTKVLDLENSIVSYVLGDKSRKLELVYTTMVAFVKWYNENKKEEN